MSTQPAYGAKAKSQGVLKVGFVGTGNISWTHLRILEKRKDIKIVSLCDIVEDHAKEKQAVFGGEIFLDHVDMLKKGPKLDAVWVCTPSTAREEILVNCTKAGLPVFCEKPAERKVAVAKRIADKLDKIPGARVQIGYVFRSMALTQRLKEMMADDKIHTFMSAYACGASTQNLLPAWFYDNDLSGGALVDQATHNFDWLRYLFGEVVEVSGFATNPFRKKTMSKKGNYTIDETIAMSLKFANGITGTHTHSWLADTWRNEVVLFGEKRKYHVNLGNCTIKVESAREETLFTQRSGTMYVYENEKFIDAVRSGDWSKNPSTYRDAAKSLVLTQACIDSLNKGIQKVKF